MVCLRDVPPRESTHWDGKKICFMCQSWQQDPLLSDTQLSPTSVLHAPAIRQGIACLQGFTQEKNSHKLSITPVWKEALLPPVHVSFLFIW